MKASLLTLIILTLSCSAASAADGRKAPEFIKETDNEEKVDSDFAVPQSRFYDSKPVAQDLAHPPGTHLILTLGTSFASHPDNARYDTFLTNTSAFSSRSLPSVHLDYTSEPFRLGRIGTIAPHLGVGLQAFSRVADLPYSGGTLPQEQQLIVFPIKLGIEYYPVFARGKTFTGYFSMGAQPLVSFLQNSAISEGESLFGILAYAGIGLTTRLSPSLELETDLEQTSGSLRSIDLAATSLLLGVRLGL